MDNKEAAITLINVGMGIVFKKQNAANLDTYELFSENNDMYRVKASVDGKTIDETFPFVQNNPQYKQIALDTAIARFFQLTLPPKNSSRVTF